MGAIGDAVGGVFGIGGGSAKNQVDRNLFNDPNAAANKARINQQMSDLGNKGAYTSGYTNIDPTQQNEFRNRELSLADTLQQRASGQGPSIAGALLNRGQDRAIAQQQALAASAGNNINPALLQKNIMNNTAQIQTDTAANAGIQGMQEAQQAQAQLGQILGQGRGADIGLATSQAGLNQQTNLANTAGLNQQQQLADQLRQSYMAQLLGIDQNQFAALQNYSAQRSGAAQADNNQFGKTLGAVGTGLALFSDERAKEDISDAPKDMSNFLNALSAKTYKYKDETLPGAAPGQRFGILAQDLEKSDVGKSLVRETEQGKMIDGPQAIGALLAVASEMNRRLKKIERKN